MSAGRPPRPGQRAGAGAGAGGERHWSPEQAERHLRSLELFGMRFGLERMRRLTTVLGRPQGSFSAVHVLGSNGKSSTARMIAAALQAGGMRSGSYLSPHLRSYSERLQIGGAEISADGFAEAIERAAKAAAQVNRTLAEDDHVTQFELLSAAALWALASHGVEVAVIEAGLGGRYDATNVLAAELCVLTNVSLEHTRWLGPRIADIASEKLAVVPAGGRLVLGPEPHAEVLALAERLRRELGVELVVADAGVAGAAGCPPFQRRNLATALLAAERFLAARQIALSDPARDAAGAVAECVPGRFQRVRSAPLTIFDGAHNPDGARELRRALASLGERHAIGLVLGVLEDKDAVAMLQELLPCCERAWFTAPPDARALSPAALHSLARQIGFAEATCQPQPALALQEAWRWAQAEAQRAVLAAGSIYLIGELMTACGDRLEGLTPGSAAAGGAPMRAVLEGR